ncbi:ovarian cancer G-protein coupled receptor 1-like isoform X1 [Xyrichtys novacula]|uniref:Ovarian cancer G-protein coupled receptor 1-like isoform X1 n=1 Tax=Xyrichtys novacula TaxID=13765 RepID=A0AAV1ESD2_XYRNO|nr:ovarian cancer G-protein coupled receptor 1-like isoform X1 [Xyrichtys novacula]
MENAFTNGTNQTVYALQKFLATRPRKLWNLWDRRQPSYYLSYTNYVTRAVTYTVASIGIPLILMAVYSVYFMVRSDHVAPIYIINLLVSDLIQLCCMISWEVPSLSLNGGRISSEVHQSAVLASVGFMVALAMERYLVIVHPLRYCVRRSIKTTVVVCVVIWAVSIALHFSYGTIVGSFLLPFPLLIFFLVRTLRALSRSISVPVNEKQRIAGVLILVLVIYTLLFLPAVILILVGAVSRSVLRNLNLWRMYHICMRVSVIADLVLYVFIRKGTISKLTDLVCCRKVKNNNPETTTTDGGSGA